MAEHANAGRIREGYAAFSRGDLATLGQLFTQDVQWHEAGRGFELAGDYKGQDAVFSMFGRLVELTDGHFEVKVEEVIADDRQAIAIHTATIRMGAQLYHSRESIVFHLLEGKVTDAWHTVPDVEAYDAFWASATSATPVDAEHPNVTRTRLGYAAFSAGDMTTLAEFLDENVVWHVAGSSRISGNYYGRDDVFGFFATLMQETGGELRLDVHDIVGGDDHVVTMVRGTATRNGVTLVSDAVHVAHVRDGRVMEFWDVEVDQAAADEFWA